MQRVRFLSVVLKNYRMLADSLSKIALDSLPRARIKYDTCA